MHGQGFIRTPERRLCLARALALNLDTNPETARVAERPSNDAHACLSCNHLFPTTGELTTPSLDLDTLETAKIFAAFGPLRESRRNGECLTSVCVPKPPNRPGALPLVFVPSLPSALACLTSAPNPILVPWSIASSGRLVDRIPLERKDGHRKDSWRSVRPPPLGSRGPLLRLCSRCCHQQHPDPCFNCSEELHPCPRWLLDRHGLPIN
jgi:hypothetical protein